MASNVKLLAFLRDPVAAFEANPEQQCIIRAMFSHPKMAHQAWIALSQNPAITSDIIAHLDDDKQRILSSATLSSAKLANDIACDAIYQLPTREHFLANLGKHCGKPWDKPWDQPWDKPWDQPLDKHCGKPSDKPWDMNIISAKLPISLDDVLSTNIKWNWLSLFTNPHLFD